ncbi:MAG: hypothetical protein PHE67_00535 [Campylobacterales bacterium]|nr:hypothetical protein [Campylobacterales bacterium]
MEQTETQVDSTAGALSKAEKNKRKRQKKKAKLAASGTTSTQSNKTAEPKRRQTYTERMDELKNGRIARMKLAVDRQDGEKPAILVASNKTAVLNLSSMLLTLERCEDTATSRLTRAYKAGNAEVITSLMSKPEIVKEALDKAIGIIQNMLDETYLSEGFGGEKAKKESLARLGRTNTQDDALVETNGDGSGDGTGTTSASEGSEENPTTRRTRRAS